MTYYTASQFTERWYMTFKDMQDGLWRISIEDPTFSGTATQLTPSANPFEWMGNGDEDQTKCVLGSTGTMRIMVTNESDIADLRPTELNNRRVTAKRSTDNGLHYTTLWQGFLKQEEYSQDWIAAPYELELPIRSALDLAEDMTLPRVMDVRGSVQSTADLFRYVIELLGVNVSYIATNKPLYQDYSGRYRKADNKPAGTYDAKVHWTQAFASASCFYDASHLQFTPKPLASVLEAILYPYGRLTECGDTWLVRMNSKEMNNLYWLAVDGTTAKFSDSVTGKNTAFLYASHNPTSSSHWKVNICGTDNTISKVSAPAEVTFSANAKNSESIFSLSKDLIVGGVDTSKTMERYSGDGYNNYTTELEQSEIIDPDGLIEYRHNVKPCRIIKVEAADKMSDTVELGFRMTANTSTESGKTRIRINIPKTIRSIANYNKIRLTLKIYNANGNVTTAPDGLRYCVYCNGKYLHGYYTGNYSWLDPDTEGDDDFYDIKNLPWIENDKKYAIDFNEFRESGDMRMLKMRIAFNTNVSAKWTIVPTLEYINDTELTTVGVQKQMFGEIAYNETICQTYGAGDNLDIKMKTAVADLFSISGQNCNIPWAGFCDTRLELNADGTIKTGYIDIKDRTKLEIEEARTVDPVRLILNPFTYYIGSEIYIPVATGMNARNCTTQLRLVSTNI